MTVAEHLVMVRQSGPPASKRCVVLLSGGIDSTTLLYSLVSEYECYPLTINYGQRHSKECVAARNVCEARDHNLLLRWKYLDLSVLKVLIHSALHGFGDIPEGHYSAASQAATVSPNRNMIFLAIAAGYAQTVGAGYVAYAAHSNDRAIYPDCRPEFVKSCAETVRLGTGGLVGLLAPFVNVTKADIIRLGKRLNVPFRLTWTCYLGEERPCGRCGTCVERTESFKLAGFPDPALTPEEWSKALEYLEEVSK